MIKYKEKQYISRDVLYDEGFSPYLIRKLVDSGELIPVNRRFFKNPDYEGTQSDFSSVSIYAEKGVVCLISAAVYHGLSNERPNRVDVALPRGTRIPEGPEWPVMQFYLFSGDRYSTGIEEVTEENRRFFIYDKEKTVCDALFYRNKLGFEPAAEILKNYMNRNDRDINKLMKYAEKLRSGNLLRSYLEVMV